MKLVFGDCYAFYSYDTISNMMRHPFEEVCNSKWADKSILQVVVRMNWKMVIIVITFNRKDHNDISNDESKVDDNDIDENAIPTLAIQYSEEQLARMKVGLQESKSHEIEGIGGTKKNVVERSK